MKKNGSELRDIRIIKDFTKHADGSVLIEVGDTKVICTAMVEEKIPMFLRGSGSGWVSAEYAMIPSSTAQRKIRDISKGKLDGRSSEIQRLIGRALRSVVNMKALGERTIWIDCDVIQADGGTRTAAITGSFVALALACKKLKDQGKIKKYPIHDYVTAISVGKVNEELVLDLCYEEDSNAQVDMNLVISGSGQFIEIQGTAEKEPFSRDEMNKMMDLAFEGCRIIQEIQSDVLGMEIHKLISSFEEVKATEKKKVTPQYDNSPYKKDGQLEMVIASSNSHKIQEMGEMLRMLNIRLLSMEDVGLSGLEIEENGSSFEENAMIKAVEVMKRTGKIAIADDSGLSVAALNGQPGIYSARFSGETASDQSNNDKLLEMMKDVLPDQRQGRFVSVIAIAFPDGRQGHYKGVCEGSITYKPVGENGFGYDPLFFIPEINKTYAELSPEEKNGISHRSRALRNMRKKLKDLLGEEVETEEKK